MKKLLLAIILFTSFINLSYSQVANQPLDILKCDDGIADGITAFDLTVNISQVLGSQNPSLFTVSFHYSQTGADSYSNIISTPTLFYNTFPYLQTIYVRVTENSTGNYDTTTFDLYVEELPVIVINDEYFLCDDGSSITIESNLSISDYSFSWLNSLGYLIGDSNTQTIYQEGWYELFVVSNSNGCQSLSVTFLVVPIDCTDTDSDGVIDLDEDLNSNGNLDDDDTDLDSIANYLDDDDDGDNVPTIVEITVATGRSSSQMYAFIDTDNDFIENYLDDDDDGDNVLTIDEDYNNNGDPTDDDTNTNGIPDYLDNAVSLSVTEYTDNYFELFPNPANNEVTIKALNQISNISIIDILGKQVYSKTINDSLTELKIDVSSFNTGLYIVKVLNNSKISIKKLIIQ